MVIIRKHGELSLSDDVAHAAGSAAATGAILITIESVVVIEGKFLAALDVMQGVDPDAPSVNFRLTIWCAAVIDETGCVQSHVAIDVIVIIQRKDIGVLFFQLGLGGGF